MEIVNLMCAKNVLGRILHLYMNTRYTRQTHIMCMRNSVVAGDVIVANPCTITPRITNHGIAKHANLIFVMTV